MPEMPTNEPVAGGSSLDPFGGAPASTSVSAPVDSNRATQSLRRLFSSMVGDVDRVTAAYRRLEQQVGRVQQRMNRLRSGGSGTTTTTTADATQNAINSSQQAASGGGGGGFRAMLGGVKGGLGAAAARAGSFVSAGGGLPVISAMMVGQQQLGRLDGRTDSAYGGMLARDRLSVLYQQTQGITQNQYYDNYRQPLQQFRLGVGGIDALLAMQARTGINAQRQAGSIQGLSAASGYAYSTQDFIQMIQTLANPMVNNRLSMTLGTGIYGPGGSERSLTQVFQQVVRGAGLTNRRVIESGKSVGSLTRARLSALGIPEDMHDLVLQYAEENVQFQRRTGGKQGMYNPEQRTHRNIMGIEQNLATQREETDRMRELRDEKYYNRQKDNMSALERNTQAIINLQTKMEEVFSGIIGARISTRGNMLARVGKGLVGIGQIVAGGAMIAGTMGGGTPLGSVMIASGLGTTANALFPSIGGDPVTKGKSGPVYARSPHPSAGKTRELNINFRSRLSQMLSDNPNLRIVEGFRSAADQRKMFFDRYSRTNEETGVFWDGSFWKKNANAPDAAPPGTSMHELGLAVDLGGDLAWVQQNASRYGLKTAAAMGEPWHITPSELPFAREEYEGDGAPWGRPAGAAPFDRNARFEGGEASSSDRLKYQTSVGIASAKIAATGQLSASALPSSAPTRATTATLVKGIPSASEIPAGFMFRTTPSYGGWGYYVPQDFKDDDLEALHRQEQPSWFVGPITNSHGTFYGGFSMSTYNWNRAKEGLAAKGIDTSKWGPHANDSIERQKMAAEYLLDELSAHNGWEPIVRGTVNWPGVGKLPSVSLPGTQSPTTIRSSKTGDPIRPTRGGGTTIVSGGNSMTLAPSIYIQSTGSNEVDARRTAQEFLRIFNNSVKVEALRRS